jgi:hypothetical protein
MKQHCLLIIFLFLTTIFSYGQDEKVNQYDSIGKKHGKWVEYLDYYWNVKKDSSKAVYYRYTWYDHGLNTIQMGNRGRRGWKFEPVADTNGLNGKPKLLNGEYRSYDKNGQLRFFNVLDKGNYVLYIGYGKSGETKMKIEFMKRLNNIPHTYAMYIYKNDGDLLCYYMSKGPRGGWLAYGSHADSTSRDTLKIAGDSTFVTVHYFLNGKVVGKQDKISIKEPGKTTPRRIMHGNSITWYYNGQKKSEGYFQYGKKTGEWKYWHKNGKEAKLESWGTPITE